MTNDNTQDLVRHRSELLEQVATLLADKQCLDTLRAQIVDLMQTCAHLRAERDAWRETAQRAMADPQSVTSQRWTAQPPLYEVCIATDATDPPHSVPNLAPNPAPNHAPFPANALKGGDGRFMG